MGADKKHIFDKLVVSLGLFVVFCLVVWWDIGREARAEANRVPRMQRFITEIMPAYETAMLVGDKERACREATLMNQYAIDSHNAEFAKPYYKMKEEACQ